MRDDKLEVTDMVVSLQPDGVEWIQNKITQLYEDVQEHFGIEHDEAKVALVLNIGALEAKHSYHHGVDLAPPEEKEEYFENWSEEEDIRLHGPMHIIVYGFRTEYERLRELFEETQNQH